MSEDATKNAVWAQAVVVLGCVTVATLFLTWLLGLIVTGGNPLWFIK